MRARRSYGSGCEVDLRVAEGVLDGGGDRWRERAIEAVDEGGGGAVVACGADDASGLRTALAGRPPERQQPQRGEQQAAEGRLRDGGDRGAAGPAGEPRAAVGGQGADALAWLRRQDPVLVRARHDDTGDPGPPGGYLSGGGVAHADLERDRGGDRRGPCLAVAAARCGLSDRVSGCAGGEDAHRGTSRKPRRV